MGTVSAVGDQLGLSAVSGTIADCCDDMSMIGSAGNDVANEYDLISFGYQSYHKYQTRNTYSVYYLEYGDHMHEGGLPLTLSDCTDPIRDSNVQKAEHCECYSTDENPRSYGHNKYEATH